MDAFSVVIVGIQIRFCTHVLTERESYKSYGVTSTYTQYKVLRSEWCGTTTVHLHSESEASAKNASVRAWHAETAVSWTTH